jgi:histidine triad (HIT) family protein
MAYNKDNIFAKILRSELPCQKVFEDEEVLAFNDISKTAPIHVLVIPKGQFIDFEDFTLNAGDEIVASFFKKVAQIAQSLDLKAGSYRLITNKGIEAAQSVQHFHVHILGGKQMGALL